jgi:hypothetical protein
MSGSEKQGWQKRLTVIGDMSLAAILSSVPAGIVSNLVGLDPVGTIGVLAIFTAILWVWVGD